MNTVRPINDRYGRPDEETTGHLRAGLDFLNAFRSVEPNMPLSYALGFMHVALDPGYGTVHYARAMAMHQPVTSRILLEIGQKTRTGGPGLGLVDSVYDTVDLRLKRYFLTPKGKLLVQAIVKEMSRRRMGEVIPLRSGKDVDQR